jgi:endonuclease G
MQQYQHPPLWAYPAAIALITILALFNSANAASTSCPGIYFNDIAPDNHSTFQSKNHELCNTAFATMHSGVTRTPLWSADHLTREHIYQGKGLKRNDAFHPDERLPANERSELSDYKNSGYDRGHVVASADEYDERTQYESFALSNMTPQNSALNRGVFAGEESAARMLAKSIGEVYVVTMPLFIGNNLQWINNRVAVPTHYIKAIFDPIHNQAGAYLNTNTDSQDYKVISIDEATRISGIDPFPFLSGPTRANAMSLPKPIAPHFNDNGNTGNEHGSSSDSGSLEKDVVLAEKLLKHLLH